MTLPFKFSKQLFPILLIVGSLAALTCYYYVAYIPENESKLNKQHFRWLQKIDQNIREQIQSYDSLLSSLMRVYNQQSRKNEVEIDRFLKSHEAPGFTISDTILPLNAKNGVRSTLTHQKNTATPENNLDYINSLKDRKFLMMADSSIDELVLTLNQCGSNEIYSISININFDDFIRPLLPEDIFEHYVVFYNGKYIYEDFHSGLSYKSEDSLFLGKKGVSSASIIEQKIAGESYYVFLQPIYLGNKKIVVAGLHSFRKFSSEKRKIEPTTTIFFIAVCLLILLFIPWLKVLALGRYDKLHLSDSVWSMIVAKLFVSIIAYLFIKSAYLIAIDDCAGNQHIAKNIAGNIAKEIDSASRILERVDGLLPGGTFFDLNNVGSPGKNIIQKYADGSGRERALTKDDSIGKTLDSLTARIRFNQAFWLNANGDEMANWTSQEFNDIHGNYKDREYFKYVKRTFKQDTANALPYFGQLVSRTSATFKTVLSKRSAKNNLTVVMAFDLRCVNKPILPIGYDFAVIDGNGEVRYHSKEKRNLNENLLEEFSDDGSFKLRRAIRGGFETNFQTEYYERPIDVFVRPMQNYDYYVVVMRNKEYPQIIETDVFIFTITMTIIFLLCSLLDVFIVVFFSSKRSYVKSESIATSWLWPRESSINEYFLGVTAYVFVFVLSIAYYLFVPGILVFLFVILINPPMLSLLLNNFFLIKYQHVNIWYWKLKKRARCASLVYVVLINIIGAAAMSFSFLWLLLYEVLIVGVFLILLKSKDTVVRFFSKLKWADYLSWYSLMVYVRVIITSGIPVVFCIVSSHNYEKVLATRFAQIDFVKKMRGMLSKQNMMELGDAKRGNSVAYAHAVYYDNIAVAGVSKNVCTQAATFSAEQKTAVYLYKQLGKILQDNFASSALYRSTAFDSSFQFDNIFHHLVKNTQRNPICVRSTVALDPITAENNNRYICLLSGNSEFYNNLPPFRSGIFLIWTMLFVILILSYLLLRAVIRRLFSRKVALFESVYNEDVKLDQKIKDYPMLLLLGPNFDDQKELFLNGVDPLYIDIENLDSKSKLYEDAMNINEKKCIIIKNMENILFKSDGRLKKLQALQEMKRKGKCIIMTSAKHPLAIISDAGPLSDPNKLALSSEEQAILIELLGHVPVIEAPYFKSNIYPSLPIPDFKGALRDLINTETKRSVFLNKLRVELLRIYDIATVNEQHAERLVTCDSLLFKIQVEASNLYNTIWSSLSEREKFILIDLAEDGLVNTTDIYNTTKLINKGVIVIEDGGLHIFSRSFRNYILTSLSSAENEKIKQIYKEKNSWEKLRTPLLIATIAILAFLSISQDDIYARIIGIFGGLTTVLPLLAKTFAFMGNNNSKKEV